MRMSARAVLTLCLVTAVPLVTACDEAIDALKGEPEVVLRNSSDRTIGNFFRRGCSGATNWSRMGGGIAPGDEITYQLDTGCYDFMAEMTSGQELLWEDQTLGYGDALTLDVYTDY